MQRDANVLAVVNLDISERNDGTIPPTQFTMDDIQKRNTQDQISPTMSPTILPTAEATEPSEDVKSSPADDPKAALAARMARFKALQAQKVSGRKATEREVRDAEDRSTRLAQISKLQDAHEKARP